MIVRSILPFLNGAFRKSSALPNSAFRLAHCFCEGKQEQSMDELKNYQKYLTKFNESIRKPHEKQQKQQQRLIETYLAQKRYPQIVSFLVRNTGNTLCSTTSTSKIDADLAVNWPNLSKRDQNQAAYALSYFRQAKIFEIFKKQVEAGIKLKGVQGVQCQELIVFLCGELINRKSLRFISKLYPKTTKRFQIFDKIYKFIDNKNYKGICERQKNNLLNYIGLMLDPTLNKKQDNLQQRQRSPLQITIESFLSVLQIEYERQVKLNNFYVDYLVKVKKNNQIKQFVLEVNGNHHYTINGQLKGRQILRNLIINEYAPLRIIHYQDFLVSKGHRNKIAYIDSLFSQNAINWDCKKGGKNSRWNVKIDEQLMKQN